MSKRTDIEALNKQLMSLLGAQDPKALEIIGKIKKMGMREKDNRLIGYAHYRYAYFYYFSELDLYKFRKHVQLAIRYLLRSDDKEYLGGAYNLVAYDAQDQGCYDIAYAYFMIAVQISEQQEGIALPGLVEASAGRLLIELGEYKKGRKQQQSAIRRMWPFTDMYVYHYNMIITYADIALASFLLEDGAGVDAALKKIEIHYQKASREEVRLSRTYYLLAGLYKALLLQKEDRIEEQLQDLLKLWKKPQWNELSGLLFEIESICGYMLSQGYDRLVAQILKVASSIEKNENQAIVLRYSTLQALYYETVQDLPKLRKCLYKQHEIQARQKVEAVKTLRYSMEFSDMIENIAREREQAERENLLLQKKAATDPLTGLPNRSMMHRVLQQKFEEAEEQKTSFGIGIIDIDHFKQYNDRYGYQAGDACLRQVGNVLLSFHSDPRVFCARYGGDEFVVGYFGLSSREITKIKKEMQEKILQESTLTQQRPIRISQGVHNRVPDGTKKVWDYLSVADRKLYRIKKEKYEAAKLRKYAGSDGYDSNEPMDQEERLKALKEYVDRTKRILELSSPQLDTIKNAEDYRQHLLQSFREIGLLGRENSRILDRCLYPILHKDVALTEEETEDLRTFSTLLVDTTSMENLDLPLIYVQAEKILEDAEKNGDLRAQIHALDNMVIASYMMVNLTIRLYPEIDVCFRYRDAGLMAGEKLLEHLEPEKFRALPDDSCRELVLINARYIRCLFEWDDQPDKKAVNKNDLQRMKQALALAEDPFYREQMPAYHWDIHVFRTLQYMCDFTEDNNKHRFNKAQLREIYGYTKQLVSYLQAHPELQEGCPKTEQELYLARNGYLVGEQSLEEYRESLLRIIGELDPKDFSARSVYMRFTAAQEYILTLHARAVKEEQKKILHVIYEDIAAYAYHMPKTGVLSFMLTFLSNLLRHYIKVSDGSVFRDICLKIMAAMHPPTYVHTLSVAGITRYLAEQLFRRDPSRFIGIAGAKTKEEVLRKKDKILSFIYNAAMLHDVGKLFIIETIITYGRDLVEAEWKLIQAHTVVGAALLRRIPETAVYAEIAEGHHRWFDNSQGYPETFDMQSARYPTVLSLLSAADCIDAATDSIGRSYKTGKTLEDCITELQNGSGSRYAPYVVELFSDPQIKADLQRLLNEGRDENYRKTYDLLKTL